MLGAAVGYFGRLGQRIIAAIMAFGGGVLISALAGLITVLGFLAAFVLTKLRA